MGGGGTREPGPQRPGFFIGAVVGLLLSAGPARAVTVVLEDAAPAEVSLRVGSEGAVIDTVQFEVDGQIAGTGTAVDGTPEIYVEVLARVPAPQGGGRPGGRPGGGGGGPPGANRSFVLTVDSSTPLSNALGRSIPMTEIGWISSDQDIPSGEFLGTPDQLLLQFEASRRIFNTQRFYFRNQGLYEPGSYSGTVTYTLANP